MDDQLLQMAMILANSRMSTYNHDDLRNFAFDRMVDEIYADLQRERERNNGHGK